MQNVHNDTIATIDELRSVLMEIERPLGIVDLRELTSRLQLVPNDWQKHLAFDPHQFCFRTVYDSPNFEINIIGWRSGQYSSVHDHRGAACCVLVLDGVLTNIDYRISSGTELTQTMQTDLHPGEILPRSGWEIHRCGNSQPRGEDLVTFHLYSPPLLPLSEREYRG